ncbi:hypothetical protein EIP86_005979 [Pleurotus ostreatoroseus]|nr:hypothetical protein EIP86_005979 [Pleurotus ostreatoroseus]
MANSDLHLQAIADGISARLGVACTILMAGPCPRLGGRINCTSMHSGESLGAAGKIWPDWDPAGFRAVERKMMDFAAAIFPPEERERRALPGTLASATTIDALQPAPAPSHALIAMHSDEENDSDGSDILVLPTAKTRAQRSKARAVAAATSAGEQHEGALPAAAKKTTSPSIPPSQDRDDQPLPLPERTLPEAPIASATHSKAADPAPVHLPLPASSGQAPPAEEPRQVRRRPQPRIVVKPSTTNVPSGTPSLPTTTSQSPAQEQLQSPAQEPQPPAQDQSQPPAQDDPQPSAQDEPQPPAEDEPHSSLISTSPSPPLSSAEQDVSLLPNIDLSDFPGHCRSAYALITEEVAWGTSWIQCVRAAIDLQRAEGHPDAPRKPLLPTDGRPSPYKAWFQYGRPVKPPTIDLATFPGEFKAWWRSIQPSERGANRNERPQAFASDAWTKVRLPTKSGFYLLLVGLAWWRKAVVAAGDPERELRDWRLVVDDVAWAVTVWDSGLGKRKDAPANDAENNLSEFERLGDNDEILRIQ